MTSNYWWVSDDNCACKRCPCCGKLVGAAPYVGGPIWIAPYPYPYATDGTAGAPITYKVITTNTTKEE